MSRKLFDSEIEALAQMISAGAIECSIFDSSILEIFNSDGHKVAARVEAIANARLAQEEDDGA